MLKVFYALVILLAQASLFYVNIVFAQVNHKAIITSNYVRVRTQPSANGPIITYCNNGEIINIISKSDKKQKIGKNNDYWYKIKLKNSKEGWVYGIYLKQVKQEKKIMPAAEQSRIEQSSNALLEVRNNEVLFYEDKLKTRLLKKISFKPYNSDEKIDTFVKYGKTAYYVYNEVVMMPDGLIIKEITEMPDSKITRLEIYDNAGTRAGYLDIIFDYSISPDFNYFVIFPNKGPVSYYGEKILFYSKAGKFLAEYKCGSVNFIQNPVYSANSDYLALIKVNFGNNSDILLFKRDGNLVKKEEARDFENKELIVKDDGSYEFKKK